MSFFAEPIGFYTGVLQMDTETDEGAVSPYCFTVPVCTRANFIDNSVLVLG